MICIKETSKNKGYSRSQRLRFLEGLTPVVSAQFGTHGKRYTMLAAGNINSFVTEACEVIEQKHGHNDTDPTCSNINRARFEEWIRDKLPPVQGKTDLFNHVWW